LPLRDRVERIELWLNRGHLLWWLLPPSILTVITGVLGYLRAVSFGALVTGLIAAFSVPSLALAALFSAASRFRRKEPNVTAITRARSESLATTDTRQDVVQPIPAVNSDRIFVSRTPEQFMDMCRGKMAVEQDRIIGPFINKWLRTQIIVDDVSIPSSSGGAIWAGEQSRRIISKFDKKWDARLHVLSKGEHLEIIGKIEHVDGSAVHLTECEII
jgi:hypothetical protein